MPEAHEINQAEAVLDTLTKDELERKVEEYDESKQVPLTRNQAACLKIMN